MGGLGPGPNVDREPLAPLARQRPGKVIPDGNAPESTRVIGDIEIEVHVIGTSTRFFGLILVVLPLLAPLPGIEQLEQLLRSSLNTIEERDRIRAHHFRRDQERSRQHARASPEARCEYRR